MHAVLMEHCLESNSER